MAHDLAASVRARLLNIAKAEQTDFNSVLVRYALERFLYRLGQSAHADHFVLKGAMLFNLWYAMPHWPTRDVDLLGFGPSDLQSWPAPAARRKLMWGLAMRSHRGRWMPSTRC